MSFFHFINCVVLAYAPFVITYKYSGLSEYSSMWKCLQAAFGYFLTQLVKLLLLATFFPAGDQEGFSLFPELLRSSADVVDILGMHFVMSNILTGKGEVRFISAGLGWGAAHSLASRLILFWVGARASAFSWRWIQNAVDSSSDLILFLAVAALTWMVTRSSSRALIFVFLGIAIFHSFVYQFLYSVMNVRDWNLVLARFAYTAVVGKGALFCYSSYVTPHSSKRD